MKHKWVVRIVDRIAYEVPIESESFLEPEKVKEMAEKELLMEPQKCDWDRDISILSYTKDNEKTI